MDQETPDTRISTRAIAIIVGLSAFLQVPALLGGNVAGAIGGFVGAFIGLMVVYALLATVYRFATAQKEF